MGVNYGSGYATPRMDLGVAYSEYEPDEAAWIAEQIYVPFNTPKRDATFSKRLRASMLKVVETLRAKRGKFNRINTQGKDVSYACQTHGLEIVVDDEERALYESDFDAEFAALVELMLGLKLSKEIRAATALFDASVWTGSDLYTDLSSSNPFADESSNVIGAVIDAKEKVRQNSGMRANALVMGEAVFNSLLKNTAIKARFPGAVTITQEMIANAMGPIFGLRKLIVGGGIKNTASENASSASLSDVWGSTYVSVCRVAENENTPLSMPCVGRTMKWTKLNRDMMVQTYREEQTMGDVLRALECVDELTLDTPLAHLLKVA